MTKLHLLLEFLQIIPQGKVVSYKDVGKIIGCPARKVGQYLKKNKEKLRFPCFRVVKSDGSLAEGYKFGGPLEQKRLLLSEDIKFENNKIKSAHFFKINKVLSAYFSLLKEYGLPGKWPWFSKEVYSKDEIIISAVLTQATSWKNVEKAMRNLRREKANTLLFVYSISDEKLRALIQPAGFYKRKSKTLKILAKVLRENERFFKNKTKRFLRKKLLEIPGIGNETADTILLYAFDKMVFVVDEYTKRFIKLFLNKKLSAYFEIQKFFSRHLPCHLKLFQNYHALIVRWGKENS